MTARAPEFTIVMPAFNAQRTVASAVRSALSQTHGNLEVVVVDDGSTDDTIGVVERLRDARVRLLSHPSRGVSAARNAGIAAARGRYIAFLDSDDLWLPSYLEHALRALRSTSRPGFAHTDAYAFDPRTGHVGRRGIKGRPPPLPPPEDGERFLLELLERNFVYVSTAVPADVLGAVGGFDATAAPAEDYGLWLRIAARGYRAAWIPGAHCLYRIHDGQASRDAVRLRRGERLALAGIDPAQLPSERHRALLHGRLVQIERELDRLQRRTPAVAAAQRLRRSAGELRWRARARTRWAAVPPPEVAAAFPDLRAV